MIRPPGSPRQYALFCTLAVTLLLRLPGIEWGLPPATPEVRASDLRSSYAFDEGDILSGAAKASVARLDFDPHEYHWGTLHVELVLLALDGAQALGAFHMPWRAAYYNLVAGDFTRVYVVGRLVAVAAALLTVWLLWRIPTEWAGMFAGMLVAVSPCHLLQSDQVRVDVTMTAMLVLTLLAALRTDLPTQKDSRPRLFLFLGFAAGLAIAGKYSAVTAVAAMAFAALALQRFPWRGTLAVFGGTLLGCIAGGPYILIKPRVFYEVISRYAISTAQVPAEYSVPVGKLLGTHLLGLVRFSVGLPACLLACAGLLWMLRRRSELDWIIIAGIAGYVPMLVALRWPLIRYQLPLIVLLGLCAGIALESLPKVWRYGLGAAALVMPLAACIAQIHYMRGPSTGNVIMERILAVVPPGTPIARLFREEPPLDQKVYPLGPNVLTDDLTGNPPAWVLTTDLPDGPYKPSTIALLQSGYEEVARARSERILNWATFGETRAPHDWKYTHAAFTLYRRKSP
jgi:Dolichyl-phosphate-mannose-protein mannosyltransferase